MDTMRLRDRYRQLRLYHKSTPLFFRTLKVPLAVLVLPFLQGAARFHSRPGLDLDVPKGTWRHLPNMCRLAQIGASCRIEADCKRIELRLHFLFAV